jgi:hypothetical protein
MAFEQTRTCRGVTIQSFCRRRKMYQKSLATLPLFPLIILLGLCRLYGGRPSGTVMRRHARMAHFFLSIHSSHKFSVRSFN